MNVLHSFGLQDVLYFDKQKFQFPRGISTIYGLNKSAGRNSQNSNGAGKSQFFSLLPELLYSNPLVGEKGDRTRGGTKVLDFTTYKGQRVKVKEVSKGKTSKMQLEVDGRDLGAFTATKAKSILRKYWPITEDEFNTYVYLDSRVPHPLVMGSSAERKRFFTSFFKLDRFDTERKLFAAEASKLKQVRAAFDELRAQYLKMKEDLLEPPEVEVVQQTVQKLQKKLKILHKEAAEGQELIRLLQFVANAKTQIQELAIALNGEWTAESYELAVRDNAKHVKAAKSDLVDARAWEDYTRDSAKYEQAFEHLSGRAKKLITKYGLKRALQVVGKGVQEYEEVLKSVGHIPDLEDLEGQIKRLRKIKAQGQPVRPDVDAGELQTLVRAYKHQLDHARQFKKGTCESCGQVVKIKDPQELERRIERARTKIKQHDAADEYSQNMKRLKELKKELLVGQQVVERLSTLEPYKALLNELSRLPDQPKAFEGRKLQLQVMERVWDEVKERQKLLEFFRPHIETIISAATLTSDQKAKAKRSQEVHSKINDLQERLAKKQAELEVHERISQQARDIRAKLVTMKKQLKEEKALKILIAAYSDKQLKKMAVESISSFLVTKINKYARLVFPEDYRFSFEWTTQLNLIVTRKSGKKSITSDVRKLSGAESRLFTLVLVLALLSFVPPRKRASVLILDEPTANFSQETTLAFQELLGTLSQLVPSILIITPRSEDRYKGATEFTVIKDQGKSMIVPGHPYELKS